MVSRIFRGSTPVALANATVSASTPRRPTIQLFKTSLSRLPSPASPSHTVLLPTAPKTGSHRSLTSFWSRGEYDELALLCGLPGPENRRVDVGDTAPGRQPR